MHVQYLEGTYTSMLLGFPTFGIYDRSGLAKDPPLLRPGSVRKRSCE